MTMSNIQQGLYYYLIFILPWIIGLSNALTVNPLRHGSIAFTRTIRTHHSYHHPFVLSATTSTKNTEQHEQSSSSIDKQQQEEQQESTRTNSIIPNNTTNNKKDKPYHHTVAILTMPLTSLDKIANEAILETALQHTQDKLSVVLRASNENPHPSLASLRKSVGEVYSSLWDYAMGYDNTGGQGDMVDVVVYPQNLPNAAPESWLYITKDIDCICSHDSICGWESTEASGRGTFFQSTQNQGLGGLQAHVDAVNQDRTSRNLTTVAALEVSPWPAGACAKFQDDHNVLFMDDEQLDDGILSPKKIVERTLSNNNNNNNNDNDNNNDDNDGDGMASLMGGAVIHDKSLFSQVCVGGTFDGMHYGHRKLLTLAISSVLPPTGGGNAGKLTIGVTVDKMLQHKKYSEFIPLLEERIEGVRQFVHRLAPGMKNCIKIIPIQDAFGPPGSSDPNIAANFDALVLSHETLENGHLLNQYRMETLGYQPLVLLCTRRTEPHGMSSTQLRKLRSDKQKEQEQMKLQQEQKKSLVVEYDENDNDDFEDIIINTIQ